MSRQDLLALTPDAIASLSNRGLVKRAQKELEAGQGPLLSELADGTVVGQFGEVETRLPPQVGLRDARCSCGAPGVCRHRVALALAYPAWVGTQTPAVVGASGEAWSPGRIGDEALERFLGKRAWERARAALRKGYVAEVRRVSADDAVPTVLLPTCSVRFLVPDDLAYAHCDGGERASEAVALAVWAFRAADEREPSSARLEIEVKSADSASGSAVDQLAPALQLAHELLLEGVVHSPASLGSQFERVRRALGEARLTWPALIVEDIEQELTAYHARSARYTPASAAALLCELLARERAALSGSKLPLSRILGTEDALETPLDHLRLMSLGARVQGDASYRLVEVVVADPDTATVLMMRRHYPLEAGRPAPTPTELGRRLFAPRASLSSIAGGQIVTASARRGANRLLVLGQGRVAQTSVVPSSGDWSSLPEGLRVRDVGKLERQLAERPPALVRARLLTDSVHVVEIAEVEGVSYAPGSQRLTASLVDPSGRSFRLARTYDLASPGALGELSRALGGDAGPPRFVSGRVRRRAGVLEIEPLAVVTDRLHVPDLAEPGGPAPASAGPAEATAASPHALALEQAASVLDDAAHHGLRRAGRAYLQRLAERAAPLRRLGLVTLAGRFEALHASLTRSLASGDAVEEQRLVVCWADASIRVRLCLEAQEASA